MNLPALPSHSHVIITIKDSHYPITETQYRKFLESDFDSPIELNGNIISQSAISEIMTMDKYRSKYEKPREHDSFKRYEGDSVEQVCFTSKQASTSTLRGLKRFCDNNPQALKAKAMYQERLKEHEKRFNR